MLCQTCPMDQILIVNVGKPQTNKKRLILNAYLIWVVESIDSNLTSGTINGGRSQKHVML